MQQPRHGLRTATACAQGSHEGLDAAEDRACRADQPADDHVFLAAVDGFLLGKEGEAVGAIAKVFDVRQPARVGVGNDRRFGKHFGSEHHAPHFQRPLDRGLERGGANVSTCKTASFAFAADHPFQNVKAGPGSARRAK